MHFVPPGPVDAQLFRQALADELAAESGDDGGEEVEGDAEPAEYDPTALSAYTAAAAAQMGFEPNDGPPPTGQESWFTGIPEDAQDAAWAARLEGLAPEDRAGALAGDSEALESFQRFIQGGALPTLAATAAQIEGARMVRDPLHRPLRRFGG